ncbi:VanZ family protein [bacterium]|nr:VanZ family protein [candidate division CSSED10-310 bacterium]
MSPERNKRLPGKTGRYRKLAAVPLVLYMLLIFHISSRPLSPAACRVPDWILHMLCYFTFFFLARLALIGWFLDRGSRLDNIALIMAALYGISDEWHQSFIPTRHASWIDIFWDISSALAARIVFRLITQPGQAEET